MELGIGLGTVACMFRARGCTRGNLTGKWSWKSLSGRHLRRMSCEIHAVAAWRTCCRKEWARGDFTCKLPRGIRTRRLHAHIVTWYSLRGDFVHKLSHGIRTWRLHAHIVTWYSEDGVACMLSPQEAESEWGVACMLSPQEAESERGVACMLSS